MSIKSSMMVVMKWTSDRRVQMENVSGGNLKLKVKLKHSNVMYWLTTTTKSGWRNQPTAELLQSC